MSRFLNTLPTEIICEIIKILPFDNTRNFFSCGNSIREPKKQAFYANWFRVLPVRLSHAGLQKAENFLTIELLCFIQEVVIKVEPLRDPNFGAYEDRLERILIRAFQVSTQINMIKIRYDPGYYNPEPPIYLTYTKVLASAFKETLERHRTTSLKIQIQDIRLDDCRILSRLGYLFLNRVYSLVFRIKKYNNARSFDSLKSFPKNLIEFSVINNTADFLATSAIHKIIRKINT
jgi:hypothetical protein